MCGLKQSSIGVLQKKDIVTPHVGVWIETVKTDWIDGAGGVTPHVGVWIETSVV